MINTEPKIRELLLKRLELESNDFNNAVIDAIIISIRKGDSEVKPIVDWLPSNLTPFWVSWKHERALNKLSIE
jgi:hypothetical protein